MTITVNGPGGVVVNFPDGTDTSTINNVMMQATGQQPAAAEPVSVNDVVRAGATGVPVLGGLANKANAAINAALAPVLNPLFSPENQLQGGSFGERYQNSLDIQNAMDAKFAAQHPVVNTTAQLAGGVGSLVPVGATATGARLLGLTGSTLPRMVLNSSISGAGLSAADALTRGQDIGDAAKAGAALGA